MDPNISEESRRAGRYVTVRIVSRVGDIVLFAILLYVLGMEWFVSAFAISSIFNFAVDFLGQKLWAFNNHDKRPLELLREFFFYLVVRGGNIAAAGTVYYLLYGILGLKWYIAGAIVVAIFWPIAFGLYRWMFFGSVRDLFALLRNILVKARSS